MAKKKSSNFSWSGIARMLEHLKPELKQQRFLIAGSFGALFAEVLFRLLEPWPLKFIFDQIIPIESSGDFAGNPALESFTPITLIITACVFVIVFTGLRALASYGSTVGFALAGNRVITRLRNQLYTHIQSLSLKFHGKSKTGDLLIRVISDVGLMQDVAVTAALPMIGNLFVLIGMVAVMFWLNVQLAMITLIIVPLFWITTLRLGGKIREVSRKQRRTESALAATASESFTAIRTVQSLSLENEFNKAFSQTSSTSLKEGVKAKRLAARLERTVDLLVALGTALVLGYGAWLVMRHVLTPGDLIVFLAYVKNAFKPVRNFAKYTGRLAKASAAGERVLQLLDLQPDIKDQPGAVTAPPLKGAVRFENVTFAYDPEVPVLREVNIDVHPGQSVALVAPSGAGKTSLVSMILRLYDPVSGRVCIDGQDIRSYTLASLRSQITVVLQDTLLFATSVRENITYGMGDVSDAEVEAATRLANAHGFITQLPEGYDTVLGERGATLSNGQRQRIAIARAAIRKAPILILDEPTTGLDKKNEREVTQAIEKLAKGRTTFFITHNLNSVTQADSILYLEDGRVCECGTHQELMQSDGTYAASFRAQ